MNGMNNSINEYLTAGGQSPYASLLESLYAREASNIYLLLCGGDKSTQKRDITKAKSYWQDYKLRKTHDQS